MKNRETTLNPEYLHLLILGSGCQFWSMGITSNIVSNILNPGIEICGEEII